MMGPIVVPAEKPSQKTAVVNCASFGNQIRRLGQKTHRLISLFLMSQTSAIIWPAIGFTGRRIKADLQETASET
jgi:hypothetical protein